MVRKLILTAGLAAALAGCASSSGVYNVGPDTYRTTSTAFTSMGGQGTAAKRSVQDATAYCAKTGKQMTVVDEQSNAQLSQGSTAMTFKCVG